MVLRKVSGNRLQIFKIFVYLCFTGAHDIKLETFQLPSLPASDSLTHSFQLNPQALEMIRLLPPGYNISRIPAEVDSCVAFP